MKKNCWRNRTILRSIMMDTDMIDIYDPDLIFKGMRHIYDRNVR